MAALDTSLPESFMRSSDAPRYVKAGKGVLRFFRTKPLGGFGALVLVLIMGVGAFSPGLRPTIPMSLTSITSSKAPAPLTGSEPTSTGETTSPASSSGARLQPWLASGLSSSRPSFR